MSCHGLRCHPHHHTPTAKRTSLSNACILVALAHPVVHHNPTIWMIQTKSRFTWEQYSFPFSQTPPQIGTWPRWRGSRSVCTQGRWGANVVFTQTVAHSPGVAQPWNGSCSDTSRLEAIAQVRHPDILVLPLWRHTWTPRPWSVTSSYCGLKTSPKRTNGVSVYTKPESNISLVCASLNHSCGSMTSISPQTWYAVCAHRQWSPVTKCVFLELLSTANPHVC